MGVKRVIDDVHLIPMGMANPFLIEGKDRLTLIDAGCPDKEAAVFSVIRGLGRSPDQLKRKRARNFLFGSRAPHRERGTSDLRLLLLCCRETKLPEQSARMNETPTPEIAFR